MTDRDYVHAAVWKAVKDGVLERGPCVDRGSHRGPCHGRIEAHHADYSRPLDVIWVCAEHHRKLHMRLRPEAAVNRLYSAVADLVSREFADDEIRQVFDAGLGEAHARQERAA